MKQANPSPKKWPQFGSVKFQNYSCRYRPELPLSLRNFSVEIRPREKVGVVGRTGAGKTSMALALFRILEPAEGWVFDFSNELSDSITNYMIACRKQSRYA